MNDSFWSLLTLAALLLGVVGWTLWYLRLFSTRPHPRTLDGWSRWLLLIFLLIPGLFALLAVGYAVENRRGAQVWEETRRRLEAQSEHLDRAFFRPLPVPNEQNLALAPFFARELGALPDPGTGLFTLVAKYPYQLHGLGDMPYGQHKWDGRLRRVRRVRLRGPDPSVPLDDEWNELLQHLLEDPAFPRQNPPADNPAEGVLLALTRYRPALAAFERDAAKRPLLRFPVAYNRVYPLESTYHYLQLVQLLAGTLSLRASAELAAGHSDEALRDLGLISRLYRGVADGPTIDDHLSSRTTVGIMLNSVWRGLAERRWSGEQLAQLQATLGQINFLADQLRTMRIVRAERLAKLSVWLGRTNAVAKYYPSSFEKELIPLVRRVPIGWIDQNKAFLVRMEQRYLTEALESETHRFHLDKIKDIQAEVKHSSPVYGYAARHFAQFGDFALVIARSQTTVDQAHTACALERFALDRQAYPATLAELVPGYLDRVPVDPIDGAPMRYTLTSDGRYRLYSVGWNNLDEGGKVVWQLGISPPVNYYAGDWVWQYEPFSPPATKRGK